MAQPTAATTSRPTRPDRLPGRGLGVGPRVATLFLALTGLGWSWYGWQTRVVPIRFGDVAAKIVAGETYDPAQLSAIVQEAESHLGPDCNVRVRRDIVIVRTRIADTAIERGEIDRLDDDVADLDRAARDLLACSPGESFGWFVRYGVSLRREGLSPVSLDFLRRSYAYGPREAWIAVRRNRMALANFPRLPADLQNKALAEFREMITSQLPTFAADIFTSVPADLRVGLLRALDGVPDLDRYRFVGALRARRLDVGSLGLETRPDRPWFRF